LRDTEDELHLHPIGGMAKAVLPNNAPPFQNVMVHVQTVQ
jgi:hypothetical protein